jgi:hypothetical protein
LLYPTVADIPHAKLCAFRYPASSRIDPFSDQLGGQSGLGNFEPPTSSQQS